MSNNLCKNDQTESNKNTETDTETSERRGRKQMRQTGNPNERPKNNDGEAWGKRRERKVKE